MDENVIVTTFSEDSRAYEALARIKQLAAEDQIDLHDGAVVERAQDGTLHLRDEAGNEDDGLATLTGDDAVPAYGIDVDVDGGKVTLCGAVDIASQRDAAERIALRVPGVSEVRNRLKVW